MLHDSSIQLPSFNFTFERNAGYYRFKILSIVLFTIYINIKLFKKWTLEMKKSHFPVIRHF